MTLENFFHKAKGGDQKKLVTSLHKQTPPPFP